MAPAHLRVSLVLAAAGAAVAAGGALAAQGGAVVECRHAGARHRIEVVRNPAPGRLCELRHAAPGEGGRGRLVWFAEHDSGFCHDRADRMIATLARKGWVCDVMRKRNVVAGNERGSGPDRESEPVIRVPRPP